MKVEALFFAPLIIFGQPPREAPPWSLEYAALRGQAQVAEMLLKMGEDSNRAGSQGTTPLQTASLKGHLEVVKVLLAYRARVDRPNPDGHLPLHDAAVAGHVEIIRLLLINGGEPNALVPRSGDTALMLAASWGRSEAVAALLAGGADQGLRNKRGLTARDAAIAAGYPEIAEMLKPIRAR